MLFIRMEYSSRWFRSRKRSWKAIRVEITINSKKLSPEEMLDLASKIYEGLSEEDVDEIERIALEKNVKFYGDRKTNDAENI